MFYFSTFFNSTYAAKGLTLYHSLEKVCNDFHLYIFALDDIVSEVFSNLHLKNATIITLSELEDEEMLVAKSNRSVGEYCWTCKPCSIAYCLNNFDIDHCIYVDADLYFLSSPEILLQELGDNNVLITPHNYFPKYDLSSESGIYCAHLIVFRNNPESNLVINWWRKKCLEWCYNRVEADRFGDQKYLDKWTTMFNGVHSFNHNGANGPWNQQKYRFINEEDHIKCVEEETDIKTDVVFFHFHGLRVFKFSHLLEIYTSLFDLPGSARDLFTNLILSS